LDLLEVFISQRRVQSYCIFFVIAAFFVVRPKLSEIVKGHDFPREE
jgi:hypothetical protein